MFRRKRALRLPVRADIVQGRSKSVLKQLQVLRPVPHPQPVPSPQDDIGEGQNRRFAAPNAHHLQLAVAEINRLRKGFAYGRGFRREVQAPIEQPRRCVAELNVPRRQQQRRDQPQIGQAHQAADGRRINEVEQAEPLQAQIGGDADHQQVGRSADGGAHAADQGGEAHGHENLAGGGFGPQAHADQNGQQQHHDGGVVDEGGKHRAEHQGEHEREVRLPHPKASQQPPHRLQGGGLHQPLAQHHQGADGDQGFMAEAVEEVRGLEVAKGKQGEANRQNADQAEAADLQPQPVAAEQDQGDHRQQHGRQGVRIGNVGHGGPGARWGWRKAPV